MAVLAPLTSGWLANTARTGQGASARSAMGTDLAVAAASWGVLMAVAPLLQIRRMLREASSRDVSLGYFAILQVGFLLWVAYGLVAGIPALVVPNCVALLVTACVIAVALRLRRPPG